MAAADNSKCEAERNESDPEEDEIKRDLTAVQQDGLALQHVQHQTMEICLAAVQQNGLALQHVPRYRQSLEICLAAVQQNGLALQYVPRHCQSQEIIQVARREL